MADSLGKIGQFPPMVVHMISAGEQSGDLDVMLSRVASYQQNEVERVVSALVKLVEPLMLLVMGDRNVHCDCDPASNAQYESTRLKGRKKCTTT